MFYCTIWHCFREIFEGASTNYVASNLIIVRRCLLAGRKGHRSDPIWRPGSVKVITMATVHFAKQARYLLRSTSIVRIVGEWKLSGFYSELKREPKFVRVKFDFEI